ncbi:MAG: hypothetical protein QM831_07225 [Kofleriaceae bacterium]
MVRIEDEVRRIATALGRQFDVEGDMSVRVAQHCPLCDAVLAVRINARQMDAEKLQRELFGFFDQHRCLISTPPFQMFERAERALVTAADRIASCDPDLKHRAEHEADLMAARCEEFRKLI